VQLDAIPVWVWIVTALMLLGELDMLLRPYLSFYRLRCHLLGGIALLMLILVFVPLVDMMMYVNSLLIFWLPGLILGTTVGLIYARWGSPVLFNSAQQQFYQERDWKGVLVIISAFILQWVPYELLATDFNWPRSQLIMLGALGINAFLAGLMIGRNSWYIHGYHNVGVLA
jgi:hypothetical protein